MDDLALLKAVGSVALTERIGGTPLIPLGRAIGVSDPVEILGKAEWFNPGGSVKDRAAWGMVQSGMASGALAGRTLIDATSGNTGIAYAWLGAALGFPVTLCVPANLNPQRRRMLQALGAELVLTDAMSGTDGAIEEARARVRAEPGRWFYPDQYSHPANWQAHYRTTAEEIWRDTSGRVTHLVAGIGTSGTLVGTSRRLREHNPAIEVVAVQPDSPVHVLEGIKHLPTCAVPAIYDATAHQRTIEIASDEAIATAKRLARHGVLAGWSAAAAAAAAGRLARGRTSGVVVAILPDGGERYLGDPAWEEA